MESNYLELQLFKDNHLSGTSTPEDFRILYGKIQRKVLGFRSECVEQCKYLSEISEKPIGVLFSGGMDSEVICRSFRDAGVPFTALIYQDVNGLNAHETKYAIEECQAREWRHSVIEFDLAKWLSDEAYQLAKKLKISEIELCVHLLRLEDAFSKGFYPVDGRGDICLSYKDGEISFVESEQSFKATNYLQKNGIECCPKFFKFSPEIILSWLQEPMMQIWVKYHEALNIQSTKYYKAMIHVNNWHDLQPRKKYTGFENILREYRILRDQLRSENWVNRSHRKSYFETVEELVGSQ